MGEIKSKSSVKEVKSKMPRFKKPKWLRVKLPVGQEYKKVRNIVNIPLKFNDLIFFQLSNILFS